MDTDTVLKVIEMLDANIEGLNRDKKVIDASSYPAFSKRLGLERIAGAKLAFELFSEYLQEHIHSLQNQVENDMNRGD